MFLELGSMHKLGVLLDRNPIKGQRGAGIIEIIMVTGLLVVVFQATFYFFSHFKKFQKHKKNQIDKYLMVSHINDSVDCESTIERAGYSCAIGQELEIASSLSASNTLIKTGSDNYSKIGNYLLRAKCRVCDSCESGKKIQIEALLVNSNNQPAIHPVRNRLSRWINLYSKIPFKCMMDTYN